MAEIRGVAERLPPDEHLALRVMPMPADLNPAGDVFGGWVMSMVDVAGGVVSIRRARSRVVTVAVNSFAFKQPVSVGDVVSLYANVVSVGRSSIAVDVVVYVERNPADPVIVKVTEARLTYVAVDAQGRKQPVGGPEPATALAPHGAAPSPRFGMPSRKAPPWPLIRSNSNSRFPSAMCSASTPRLCVPGIPPSPSTSRCSRSATPKIR